MFTETTVTVKTLDDELIGQTPCMRQLRKRVATLARYDVNLLLQGESGTGKELVSRAIHSLSRRHDGPFVAVNCAAVHDTLLESELFGHEAGAFTGAEHATLGFFRAADGGTILLDEIGDMSKALQGKLLRTLEDRAVTPVGSAESVPVDIRVIAATHHDLEAMVEKGTFRGDLYYRLNVVRMSMPPLRERRADIPILARHISRTVSGLLRTEVKRISPEAMALLVRCDWPGNVRQLANVIQRAYVLGQGFAIDVADLPGDFLSLSLPPPPPPATRTVGSGEFLTLQEVIGLHVRKAMDASHGVRTQAARMLGIDRKSLWRMLRKYESSDIAQ